MEGCKGHGKVWAGRDMRNVGDKVGDIENYEWDGSWEMWATMWAMIWAT